MQELGYTKYGLYHLSEDISLLVELKSWQSPKEAIGAV